MPVIITNRKCPCCADADHGDVNMTLIGIDHEGMFYLECPECGYPTYIAEDHPAYEEIASLYLEAKPRKPKFIQDMIDEELIPLIEENRKLSNKYNSLKFDNDALLKERKNYIHKEEVMKLIHKMEAGLWGYGDE